jgi:GWxTD domain-containing protein
LHLNSSVINPGMKKLMMLLAAMTLLFVMPAQSRNLWAFLSYSAFNSPEGPFLETYLAIDASTVKFVLKDNGKYQAAVNVLMTFKTGNEIKAFKKYELTSNEIDDTTKVSFHFLDQQRISLPNGTYDFEIQIADRNKNIPATPRNQTVVIDFPKDKPSFSDIELVKSFTKTDTPSELTKSGYDLVPYTYTFFPEIQTKLSFYCELYNIAKLIQPEQKFILTYYIESFENNLRLNDYSRVRKESPREVNVLLTEMSIENLASGNYNLVVEARDQKNELIASKKLFFQRVNPRAVIPIADIQSTETANTFVEKITNPDTIREFINSTYPIASGLEKSFIRTHLKTADLKTMQQFLLAFWMQRNPTNPLKSFEEYRTQVYVAQNNFGTRVKKGYQTDRGRVFLEYGPPNTRSTQYSEPSNYPYEIWQYYTLSNNQRNRKFVFYSPDMVTSDFYLLHSDATGEIYNPRWKVDLRNRIYSTIDIGETQVINAWGDMQDEYWELPN